MKIQLDRKEIKKALELYIKDTGLNKEIKEFILSKGGTISLVLKDIEPKENMVLNRTVETEEEILS